MFKALGPFINGRSTHCQSEAEADSFTKDAPDRSVNKMDGVRGRVTIRQS